jgi:soluble lytic murein transglycosylase-like protein
VTRVVHRLWIRLLPLQLILIMAAIGLVAGVTGAMTIVLLHGSYREAPLPEIIAPPPAPPPAVARVFTPEVQYWSPKIIQWAKQYGVDPNILATVIQIESCGDFMAGSGAGAQGLFQVMPFHFSQGEDMHDPDTNARRGIEYLKGGLERAGGHVGLAMAGYNGGWGVIGVGWGGWYRETRLYYIWGFADLPGCP